MDNNNEKSTSSGVRPAPPGQDSESLGVKTINYSAVPRRSKDTFDLSKSLVKADDDVMAPLGFEPEGSATKPNFYEGFSTLEGLLGDRDGYGIFRGFLRVQKHESLLDFWRSCEEFKRLANARSNLATSKAANELFNNYMHTKHLCGSLLQDGIRAKVKHKLNSGQPLSESTFDTAQEAIFSYINDLYFGKFIRTDVYKRWAGECSVKSSTKDRVSVKNGRFTGPALPPLLEEKVLALDEEQNACQWIGYDTSPRSHVRQVEGEKEGYLLQNFSKAALAGMYCQPAPPVVSVNNSDAQSLSSDALTDDSKSTVTDFSDMTSKSAEKQRNGQGLRDVPGFLPRTKRLPKARKQLPPEEFAKVLIEKLEKVAIEREQQERAAVNLVGLPHGHSGENKRELSILEAARKKHNQYQQAGMQRLQYLPRFSEPAYAIPGSSNISSSSHLVYTEPRGISGGYYPSTEPTDSASSWRGCVPENVLEKPQCVPLVNTKKQWESVGTIESAPDSGVSVEEESALPPERRGWILQWMEQGEKESHLNPQHSNNRTKHSVAYNPGQPGILEQGMSHMQPIAQDPYMPPLTQPDPRNTIEEVSRRLKNHPREKRSKSHHRSRSGYTSSRSSQMAAPQFTSDSADCSSIMSRDYIPAAPCMYSSSSVLSSVPSTVNSNDSGLGSAQKKNKDGTTVVYYLPGEKCPYQSLLPGKVVLLSQFKQLIAFKKGNYRYFFKKKTDEEDCGAVLEEITDDNATLPCFNNKVVCKVEEARS